MSDKTTLDPLSDHDKSMLKVSFQKIARHYDSWLAANETLETNGFYDKVYWERHTATHYTLHVRESGRSYDLMWCYEEWRFCEGHYSKTIKTSGFLATMFEFVYRLIESNSEIIY